MQSTAPHQALRSYLLIITRTHCLTYLKCLSKTSLRDWLHTNYGSSSFSVPFMRLSPSLQTQLVPSFISVLYYPPLCVSSSHLPLCFLIPFVLSLHFTLLVSKFPQVLLEREFYGSKKNVRRCTNYHQQHNDNLKLTEFIAFCQFKCASSFLVKKQNTTK